MFQQVKKFWKNFTLQLKDENLPRIPSSYFKRNYYRIGDCRLIGVELDNSSIKIKDFVHPERCIYLLGAEDNGLTKLAINKCHSLVQLPGDYSMNVAVAGSIVMFDRLNKSNNP